MGKAVNRQAIASVVFAGAAAVGAAMVGLSAIAPDAASAQNDASCVSRIATPASGKVELHGVNGCGIAVNYNLCAVSGATPAPVRFARLLKPGEGWSFAVPAAAGSTPIVASDYCRALPGAPSCQVACPSATAFGKPKWLMLPDLADSFPQGALRQGVSGKVVLACTFAAAGGRLENCRIASETPADMGFGNAALRASRGFRAAPVGNDGKSIAGTAVEVPINFAVPE